MSKEVSLNLATACAFLLLPSLMFGMPLDSKLTDPRTATPESMASPPSSTLQLRVREDSPLPDGCTAQMVADVLLGFISAFNRGDFDAAIQFFPEDATGSPMEPPLPGQFGWFAVSGAAGSFNPGFGALNREELLPYLEERHALNERLQLLQLEVAGSSWHDGIDIVFDVHRQADDIPTHVAGGKGMADCFGGTISVWQLGDREGLPDFLNPSPVPS